MSARRRSWILLIVLAATAMWGSSLYLGWQEFLEYGTCYDIQGDEDTQRKCDGIAADIITGHRLVYLAAALTAIAMVLVGVVHEVRSSPVFDRRPGLGWLVLASPPGFVGYVAGRYVTRAAAFRSRRP